MFPYKFTCAWRIGAGVKIMQDLFLKPRSKKSGSGGPVGVATDRDFRGSWFECRNDGLVSKKMKVFSISEKNIYNYLKLNKSLNT